MRKIIILIISFVMSLFLMTSRVSALSYASDELKTRKQCPKYELAKANSNYTISHISCYNDYSSALNAMNSSRFGISMP